MERPGEKLKRIRERLKLTYRDVELASQQIARRLDNPEFAIALSRLADIENKGTAPSIFRLYTICAIYRLDVAGVLAWYGAPLDALESDALQVRLPETHPFHFQPGAAVAGPARNDPGADLSKTVFLGRTAPPWAKTPLDALSGRDARRRRYAMIGLSDVSMRPILQPGSVLVIEERTKIASGEWTDEFERPIYFFEHRGGYLCGWCDLEGDRLIVLPHPSSNCRPSVFRYPADIDLVGQVVAATAILGSAKSGRRRNQTVPAESPGR